MDWDAYMEIETSDCDNSDCEDSDCESGLRTKNEDEAGFDPQSIFHKTGFTKVSKFMAFDQMPNLKVRTHVYRY